VVESSLVAEGIDSTVSIVGDKVVVQNKGVKSFLKQGFALYKDPGALARAVEGPRKKVVTAALLENRELAKIIIGAVKDSNQPEGGSPSGRALAEALKENRQAVVRAVKENDDLVKAWLRDHKELAGIVLKGDVHLFRDDVTAAALTTGPEGERFLVLTADGEELKVTYDMAREAQFLQLRDALTGGEPAEDPAALEPAPPATKTCPMCAEDVKAAALLCRFCGHRFDEAP
jgi:hypothetical protein